MEPERLITTKKALEQLQLQIQDCIEGEKAKQQSDLSPEGFAVFWLLKREGVEKAEAVARQAAAAFEQFPHWENSGEQERGLRIALFKALFDAGVEKVADFAARIMKMLGRNSR